jgi:hypothetical protein
MHVKIGKHIYHLKNFYYLHYRIIVEKSQLKRTFIPLTGYLCRWYNVNNLNKKGEDKMFQTEMRNPNTINIDKATSLEIAQIMSRENRRVNDAIDEAAESIPEEKRDQCEFLVNAICAPGCPNRKEHYRLNGLYSLKYGKPYATQDCPILENTIHPKVRGYANNLTPDDIYNTYAPQGYKYFKLEGRTLGIVENLCNYIYYMVKPEYQHYVLNYVLGEESRNKIFNRDRILVGSN